MGKKKRRKQKELLEQELLRKQILESVAHTILAIVGIVVAILTAIKSIFF